MISSAEARLERVAGALEERGFRVVIAASAEEAKDLILDLLPAGAEVRVARSVTMDQLGVTVAIEKSGRYKTIGRDLMMAHAAPDSGLQAETARRAPSTSRRLLNESSFPWSCFNSGSPPIAPSSA